MYCQRCFEDRRVNEVYKDIKNYEEFDRRYKRNVEQFTPKALLDNNDKILREIELTGAVQPSFDPMPDPNGVKDTHPQLSKRFKYVPPKQVITTIEDEYDSDYYELLKRIQNFI